MIIRKIEFTDIDAFIKLAKQLGYEVNFEYLKSRIYDVNELETVFVSIENNKVTGWIDCKIQQTYLIEPFCEIEGLIVDERERGKHVGAELLIAAEKWAKEKEVTAMLVRSNVKRERAHNFYLSNGYKNIKQSKVFKKHLYDKKADKLL